MANQYWAEADAIRAADKARTEAALLRLAASFQQAEKDKSDLMDMFKLVKAIKLGGNAPINERPQPVLRVKTR